MTFPVKYYHSGMPGAPVLSNNWGDLVGLLDACLVTGFNLKTIDSITFAAGFATATISAGHTYAVDQVVEVAGADQAAYNGEQRLSAVTANTITYPVTGTPVTPATAQGAMSCKVASLGWEKAFAGTHKAAYRSLDPQSPRHYLRVDNSAKLANGFTNYPTTNAKWANVGICEQMTDIDTMLGAQAPFDPLKPTKNWQAVQANQWGWHMWPHAMISSFSNDGAAGARTWVLVGDGRLFYVFSTWAPGYNWGGMVSSCFGDPISFKAGDAYGTVLCADDAFGSPIYTYPAQGAGEGLTNSHNRSGKLLLRSHTQLGNPVLWGTASLNTNNAAQTSGFGQGVPFPNGPDFSVLLAPVYIAQEDGHLRGLLPGLRWVLQDRPMSNLTIIDNVSGEPGKKFLFVSHGYQNVGAERCQMAFDITGPWR